MKKIALISCLFLGLALIINHGLNRLIEMSQPKQEPGVTAADLDMSNLKDTNDKKKRFFDFMRPIIIEENARVLNLRAQLEEAKNSNTNKVFVRETAKSYTVAWEIGKENWKKLFERVDAVALEVALSQSALESAWGQSRFAQQGNNFFGQWCYEKGCGIIPENRDNGSKHEVAAFNSVNESVRSYLKTINTGRVYAGLRIIRRKNREAGKPVDAKAQAGGLIKYSQKREKYVRSIRNMIKVNRKLMLGSD
jgi:Bax protein